MRLILKTLTVTTLWWISRNNLAWPVWFGWLECPPVNRKDKSVGSQSGHTPRSLVPSPAWTPRRWREHHGPAASCAPSAGDGARNPRVFPKRNQTWFADGGSTTEQRGLAKSKPFSSAPGPPLPRLPTSWAESVDVPQRRSWGGQIQRGLGLGNTSAFLPSPYPGTSRGRI